MNDDFNTREAQSALLSIASAINAHLEDRSEYDYRGLCDAVDALEELGDVLGLSFTGETDGSAELAGDVVELVLDVREQERDDGNYERADELRDELEALGIEVQDTDDGATYRLRPNNTGDGPRPVAHTHSRYSTTVRFSRISLAPRVSARHLSARLLRVAYGSTAVRCSGGSRRTHSNGRLSWQRRTVF